MSATPPPSASPPPGPPGDPNPLVRRRIEKLEALRRSGVNPFGQRFPVTHWAGELARLHQEAAEDALKAAGPLTVAGRGGAPPPHRKTPFPPPPDPSGQIQPHPRAARPGGRP